MAAFDTARPEAEIPAAPPVTPGNSANGHECSPETQTAEDIETLRKEIRRQLNIFTDEGRGKRLIEHGRIWHEAMAAVNRLDITMATDPASTEQLGEQAKAIVIAARQSHPSILTQAAILEIRSTITQNPSVLPLILEELRRIGKEDLAAKFTESL